MNLEFIDIQSLASISHSISEITDMHFSIYDGMGGMLSSSKYEDRLLAQITSYGSGKEEYETFLRRGISKAAIRNDTSVLKGPADQHFLFIPVNINNVILVLVSSPFYLDSADFDGFLLKNGPRFGITASKRDSWLGAVKVKNYESVQKLSAPVKLLFESAFKNSYERNLNYKRYQWMKTLIDVLFNLKLPVPIEEVYALVLDAILFLFQVDTASIMVREKDVYRTVMAAGRLKNDINSLIIKDNDLFSGSLEKCKLSSTNDIAAISSLGFPDSITSVQVFPRIDSDNIYGVALVYNSVISRDESFSILEFLKLVSLVLKNLSLQNAYNKCVNDVNSLNAAASGLCMKIYDRDSLYESIVDSATNLISAEKGSLMLPENGSLTIRAIKGINKWLAQDIKVRIGEGVAGKVFTEGEPFLARDIETVPNVTSKPRSHYKTGSFVSVPLKFDSEPIGVLNVSDKTTGEEFTETDLSLLNHFASYASVAIKVSDYHNLVEHMKELTITDPLTGLFNRRYLQERFVEELHRSERHNLVFSFIIFDIDEFKLFNDTEGHLAGDDVLKEVARISQAGSRVHDVLCRFGGEEFSIIMPQTAKDEAFLVAERIRKSISETFTDKWEKFPRSNITVSLGISSFPDDGENVKEIINNADIALYKAKSQGKNRTVIFSKSDRTI